MPCMFSRAHHVKTKAVHKVRLLFNIVIGIYWDFFIQIIRAVSREIFFPVLNIHFCTKRKMTDLLCCDVFSYSLKIKGTAVKPSLKFSSALSHPFAFAVQFAVFGKSYHKTGLVAANLYSSWNDEKQSRGRRNCLPSLFQKLSSLRWAWMRAHCYPVANT